MLQLDIVTRCTPIKYECFVLCTVCIAPTGPRLDDMISICATPIVFSFHHDVAVSTVANPFIIVSDAL